MNDYKIVHGYDLEHLEKAVNVQIYYGYIPVGGITLDDFHGAKRYLQPMMKVK